MRRLKIYMIIEGPDDACENFGYPWFEGWEKLRGTLRSMDVSFRAHGWELPNEEENRQLNESDTQIVAMKDHPEGLTHG